MATVLLQGVSLVGVERGAPEKEVAVMADNTTEQSVEQALAELREMFPDRDLQVKQSAWRWAEPTPTFADGRYVKVLISPAIEFKAATLADCMTQVREWHAEQLFAKRT